VFLVDMGSYAAGARSTRLIETFLWLLAVLAMLPYPLSSLARVYYSELARAQITEPAAASISAVLDPVEDVAPGKRPEQAPDPDTRLWSDGRKQALARLLSGTPASAEALLLLPGQERGIAVYDGATEAHMTLGAGRLVETSPLDGDGNIALSAHRDGAFRVLKDLAVGDQLRLQTGSRERVFEVTTLAVVRPDAVHVLAPTARTTLTLITCYPFYFIGSAPERYVVQAQLAGPDDFGLGAEDGQHQTHTASLPEQTEGAIK
jgi:sortase A